MKLDESLPTIDYITDGLVDNDKSTFLTKTNELEIKMIVNELQNRRSAGSDDISTFDTVHNQSLQKLLENVGLREAALDCFESCLSNGRQVVTQYQINLKCGVPQGLVWGSLFLLYT